MKKLRYIKLFEQFVFINESKLVEPKFIVVNYIKLYQNYIKEHLESKITYEEIENTYLSSHIDMGKIKSIELQDWNKSISKNNLFYFLSNFEYCLISNGEFQQNPFYFIDNIDDNIDDLWKAKSVKESTNKDGIYFEISLDCNFTKDFIQGPINSGTFVNMIEKRKMIFQMTKSIFKMFQKLYCDKNIDVFYIIKSTYDCFGTHPFAVLQFKVEFDS
jgi:hypothetical protein